mgnify:CR=1 FL=1
MQKLIYTLLFLSFTFLLSSQSGIKFYGGISNAKNKNSLITPEGTSHPGFHIGADARLMNGKMYFVVGGQFHSIEFLSTSEKTYFSVENKMNWTKLRAGLGYTLFQINSKFTIRGKTLASFNFLNSYPNDLASAPFQNYNSGTVGAVLGLGMDLFNFTLDVEFENGFFKTVTMVDGTEINFLTLSLGYKI